MDVIISKDVTQLQYLCAWWDREDNTVRLVDIESQPGSTSGMAEGGTDNPKILVKVISDEGTFHRKAFKNGTGEVYLSELIREDHADSDGLSREYGKFGFHTRQTFADRYGHLEMLRKSPSAIATGHGATATA